MCVNLPLFDLMLKDNSKATMLIFFIVCKWYAKDSLLVKRLHTKKAEQKKMVNIDIIGDKCLDYSERMPKIILSFRSI